MQISISPPLPPLPDVQLYKDTRDELQLIIDVLDKFPGLFDTPAALRGRRGRGGRGHPAAWWRTGEEARPQEPPYNFCLNINSDDLCNTLETQLEDTNAVVAKLQSDVNSWQDSDLTQLKEARVGLEETYDEASTDDTFPSTVNEANFIEAIDDVKQVSVWREGGRRVT